MKFALAALALVSVAAAVWTRAGDPPLGYRDTPLLPGTTWHVHDDQRPAPRVVTPGDGNSAPSDALVLFDGRDLSHWRSGEKAAAWKLANGAMIANGTGSLESVERFGDCQLHVEWAAPEKVESASQGRGNSGVFFMGRYEVQILDSFENRTYADGQAGALYGQAPPLVNVCRKPGEWQSYDLVFRAPKFDGEKLVSPARVTVLHNGVVVQDAEPFQGATAHRALAQYARHDAELPLVLQDHECAVRYRNIWVRRM